CLLFRFSSGSLARGAKSALRSRIVSAFEIGLDLVEREPGRFESLLRVQVGLVEVMLRLWVGALAELEQRHGARLRTEFDHADEGMADDAVAPLLSPCHGRVEVEDNA